MATFQFSRAVLASGCLSSLAAAAGLACFTGLALPAPAQAGAANFRCGISNGVPTTLAATHDGRTVPMIRWTSTTFDGSGWTGERRCQEVSQRFETYRQQGRLTYITTGRINGLPVICTAPKAGANCDGLLYTLKPSQNPTQALRRMLDVRYNARGAINESAGRLYVEIDALLSDSISQEPSPADLSSGSSSPLW